MSSPPLPPIAANLARVRERIVQAAIRAGRDPASITLVAVTKAHPPAYAAAAIAAGQYDIGENRPEEAWAKYGDRTQPELAGMRLHLIGTVQSRKAAIAWACQPVLIHSIDRLKIARKLSELAQGQGRSLDVLFEVNIAGEATKAGFRPDELRQALPELLSLPGLRSHGLMTIPPWDPDPEKARPHFQALRRLRDALVQEYPEADWSQLSIGMSDDFEVAIAEGATIVRIGSAIFGPRG